MRVAFDVKGTLVSNNRESQKSVRLILKAFHQLGHEITVWSNLPSYCVEFIEKNPEFESLVPYLTSKRSKHQFETDGIPLFDLAFEDDEAQHYLAAERMVFVRHIPNLSTIDEALQYVEGLIKAIPEKIAEGAD